jgi:malic enzyme
MFLLAARELAASVTDERLAVDALYPPVHALRAVSRRISIVVAAEAAAAGLSAAADRGPFDPEAAVDAAMWWPDYVPYVPARAVERRRDAEA